MTDRTEIEQAKADLEFATRYEAALTPKERITLAGVRAQIAQAEALNKLANILDARFH